MERYANRNGNSGVTRYELEADSIIVEFRDDSCYLYTYASTGATDIERMKALALAGQGLNSYISKYVRKRYAKKLR